MKKTIALLLALQLLYVMPASANTTALVTVNGHVIQLKQQSIIVSNRTYVSLNDLSAILHGTVETDNGVVTLQLKDKSLSFKPGTDQVAIAGKWTVIDQGAIVKTNVTYLPLRWVIEKAGYQIKWDASSRMVTIVAPEGYDSFVPISSNSMTDEEKTFVNEVKETKGVHKKGNLYVIARGESPNPGYGLQVVGIEQSWEKLTIHVKLTKPEKGILYPQVIAYPYVAARVNLPPYTTISFVDADTKKPLFE